MSHVLTRRLGRQSALGRPLRGISIQHLARRHQSAPPQSPSNPGEAPSTEPTGPPITPSSRLQQYYPRLVQLSTRTGVPLPSLAVSFLVLHELTAILPLFALFWLFQAIGVGSGLLAWIKGQAGVESDPNFAGEGKTDDTWSWKGTVRGWYDEAEVKIGKIGSRYGIFGYEKRDRSSNGDEGKQEGLTAPLVKKDGSAGGTVANAISAYVVVKALLPVRIAASVGLAPSLARLGMGIHRMLRRVKKSPP